MEDSTILWYIVLGAIYFLSKIFGKKKQKPEPQQDYEHESEYPTENSSQKTKSTSFDDILKKLSNKINIPETGKPVEPTPTIKPVASLVSETTPLPSYHPEKSAIEPIEKIKYFQEKKPIENEKIEFKKDEKFLTNEEYNEVLENIQHLLADSNGIKQAIILTEILNRKY